MVRLTVISQTKEDTVLKVEGWVSGADVELLEGEIMRLLGESDRLVLDLRGVRFIDQGGIALLKRWSGDRLVLRGLSLFLRTVLEEEGLV